AGHPRHGRGARRPHRRGGRSKAHRERFPGPGGQSPIGGPGPVADVRAARRTPGRAAAGGRCTGQPGRAPLPEPAVGPALDTSPPGRRRSGGHQPRGLTEEARMVRMHIWLRRKDGMSVEDFRDYWVTKHAPIVRDGYANLRGYEVHTVTRVPGGADAPYDGLGILSWDSR